MSQGALSHIRVLDISRILAGPWAGQIFADLGAEVIKVERPGRGDDTRRWGPPWLRDRDGNETAESAYYLCANRGKKSVTIDITRPRGQALIRELAASSDILLENYKVGGLARYGLDYQSLHQVNQRLIYCSITGFGQTGPYRSRSGYDFLVQGMGGLMSVTGEPDGAPGGGPQKVGVALADVMTGLYAGNACLAALAYRERTGRGQHIDMALLDVQVATLASQASNYLVSGNVPERLGNHHPNIVPYQPFASEDGHFILAVGNDDQFSRLCDLLGVSQLANDRRFATNAGRVEHKNTLIGLLSPLFEKAPSHHWIQVLEEVSVPCGPINTIDQVFGDLQVQAREMALEREHPQAGRVSMVGCPIKLSESTVTPGAAPPLLGEHTDQVLGELLGVDEAERQALRDAGIL
ncbi:MAG: CoA transferase [Gammaproteobacteria bacterium]|nr:CoA transferase [Gammaproteobacteria bacterium]